MHSKNKLTHEIRMLRDEMNKMISNAEKLNNTELLELSQRLDEALNRYHRVHYYSNKLTQGVS